jgi:hypothetical protein
MFCYRDGRPVRPDRITTLFTDLVRALDYPPIRFHDLRHEAACLLGLPAYRSRLSNSSSVTPAS